MDSCVIVNETHPFGSHSALGKKISANYRLIEDEPAFFSSYSVITNLRRPKARLQSGFFHSFHDCKSLQNELDIIEKGQMNLTDVALVKSIIANDTMLEATLHKYVDCVKGCSVKMVTGYSCGQNISNANGTVPKEVVARALRRVEKFAFVGFQEHWDESVRLFLERFGGSFTDDTLLNNRPRHSAFTEEEVEKVAVLLDQPQYQDEYDEALYQHAHDIHWKEEDVSILSNHRHQRQKRAAKHLLNEKPISSSHNLTQNLEPQ